VVSRFGCDDPAYRERSAKALGTLLHMQRGTPFIYQGEELGMTNYPFTAIEQYDDVEARNVFALRLAAGDDPQTVLSALRVQSRDHARTPMQWDDGPNAGFSTGTPWLPVNPNHRDINAQAQRHDPHSVFAHYRRLIRLRHRLPVVVDGDFALIAADHPRLFGYRRRLGESELLVLANCSTDSLDLGSASGCDDLDRWTGAHLELGNYPDGDGGLPPGQLRAWEARVYHR
jgi:oligo-1,6-glucosidase